MELVLWLLVLQGVMGAFDNLWHHEFTENLPNTPTARNEIALHSVRELIYGVIFLMLGWGIWQGWYAAALAGLILIEVFITLWDFIEEDLTRKLPPLERVLHTLLAMNYGAVLLALTPILWGWFSAPTGFTGTGYGVLSWIMTLYAIGILAWGIRDGIAAVKLTTLQVPDWKRNPIEIAMNTEPKTILVTGATGFIGRALCRSLIADSHKLLVLARDKAKAEYMFGEHAHVFESFNEIGNEERIDAVVNLAGEPVIGLPWTAKRRESIRESRIGTTDNLRKLIVRLDRKPDCLVNASAIGFYGTRSGKPLTEDDKPTDEFVSTLCRDWEAAAERIRDLGVRVCRLRFGVVLGANAGALPGLASPVKFFVGTILGSGRQIVSWLHIDDAVGLIRHALTNADLEGAANAVAPDAVTHSDLVKTIGKVLKRPVLLRAPEWPLRKLMGEMSTLLLDGERVSADKAVVSGYAFKHTDLEEALRDLLTPEPETATVYYNGACPICRHEIDLYARSAARRNAPLVFSDISKESAAIECDGVCAVDLERRLHTKLPDGRLVSGVDSFIAIYDRLSHLRWLAALLKVPGIKHLAALAYDRIAVPILAAYNARRRAAASAS